MTNTAGQDPLFVTVAARFPLLPRSRPPGQHLLRRVHELAELVESATQEPRERSATRASEALNKAALIASDCGLADLARALCWRQFEIFHTAVPLAGEAAKMALQPLVNLGRLATRDSDRAYAIFTSIFDAVTNQTTQNIDGRDIDFGNFVADAQQHHHELRRFAWTVLLAEGTRALTQAGRWTDAVQHLRRYRGLGKRLLDGRQTTILAHAAEGDYDSAVNMIKTSSTPEPWEHAVSHCLHTLCLQLGNHRADTDAMVNAYFHLRPSPEQQEFRTRLGLCVIDLAADLNRAAMTAVLERVNQEAVAATDAHIASDVLAHERCRPALSEHDFDTLVETVDSSGLSSGTMPSHLLDALVTSVKAGEERLARCLGPGRPDLITNSRANR
ncbi:hypothetical protein [Saccharopolyspora sp. SCSIO 74807]|uniref:hypothetical protein n=1 Tax=Saccharopolyspora sp. SCSIO 74807 TaxID=3118084 RepID=UPI0030CAC667